jgi:hypothetical protein
VVSVGSGSSIASARACSLASLAFKGRSFGNIRPNMPGSLLPDRVSRCSRFGCRPAMPCPGMTFTASADMDVVLRVSFGGVAAALPAGVFDEGVLTSFGIGFPCSCSGLEHGSQNATLDFSLTCRLWCYAPTYALNYYNLGKDDTCALEHRAEILRIALMEQRRVRLVAESGTDREPSMKSILVVLVIAGMSTGSMAQSGPTTLNMTCAPHADRAPAVMRESAGDPN